MLSSDMVLSKIKSPSQKPRSDPPRSLVHHCLQDYVRFFHFYFLNLWLLELGRKHRTHSKGTGGRPQEAGFTLTWVQVLVFLEQGPEECQDRRGKWLSRQLVSLEAASASSQKQRGSRGRHKLKITSRFSLSGCVFWITSNDTSIPPHIKGYPVTLQLSEEMLADLQRGSFFLSTQVRKLILLTTSTKNWGWESHFQKS